MVFRSGCSHVGISSVSCIALGLSVVFRLLAFRLLISVDDITLCSCTCRRCVQLRWSTTTTETVDLTFCIIFLRLRQYV